MRLSYANYELRYLKTGTPSAEGGFGLLLANPDDNGTVSAFLNALRQYSPDERVLVIDLAPDEPLVKIRSLIARILEYPLSRGDSDYTLTRMVKDQQAFIVIDHAERLQKDTLVWIASIMRTSANTNRFMLVIRDKASFMRNIDKLPYPDWFLGRSIPVDLESLG